MKVGVFHAQDNHENTTHNTPTNCPRLQHQVGSHDDQGIDQDKHFLVSFLDFTRPNIPHIPRLSECNSTLINIAALLLFDIFEICADSLGGIKLDQKWIRK